jgi:hypothetical protein
MAEQNSEAAALEDSPSDMEAFLRDAVEMDEVEDPDLGDVDAGPGEVVAMEDGVEVRHPLETHPFQPVEDESGQLIGKDSFPEVADGPPDVDR